MIVMKFGGTSVGNAERINNVARIISSHADKRPVVVVSAMSQVTNLLVDLADNLVGTVKQETVPAAIQQLRQVHAEAAKALNLEPAIEESLLDILDRQITKLEGITENIVALGELTPRSRDLVISFGERLSIHLVAAALQKVGAPAVPLEASQLIITDEAFGSAQPLLPASRKLVRSKIPGLVKQGVTPVITGFIGATQAGVLTTLGRGGSDYSATIIGYCLDVEEVWIWTDVDGVMTADPRVIKGAHPISELSYDEAAELSYFGAKVLHPHTMIPAALSGTPIWIKNTMNPSARGTKITGKANLHPDGAKAMTILSNLSLIAVQGKGMQGIYGVAAKVFATLAEHQINVLFISQASSENNISLVINGKRGDEAARLLKASLQAELKQKNLEAIYLDKNVAMIAVVGEGMRSHVGIAGRVFSAVGEAGINIMAIAQGSSERNISFVVKQNHAAHALQSIHDELHLEKTNGSAK
jgi:aspartate kinase